MVPWNVLKLSQDSLPMRRFIHEMELYCHFYMNFNDQIGASIHQYSPKDADVCVLMESLNSNAFSLH